MIDVDTGHERTGPWAYEDLHSPGYLKKKRQQMSMSKNTTENDRLFFSRNSESPSLLIQCNYRSARVSVFKCVLYVMKRFENFNHIWIQYLILVIGPKFFYIQWHILLNVYYITLVSFFYRHWGGHLFILLGS